MLNIPTLISTVTGALLLVAAGSAHATNYTGNYLITLTDSHPTKGKPVTECLGLTDNGSVLGYTHSGPVMFNGASGGAVFLVVNNLLFVPVLYNGTYVTFIAKVTGTAISSGAVISVQGAAPVGGSNLKVGSAGSC